MALTSREFEIYFYLYLFASLFVGKGLACGLFKLLTFGGLMHEL